MDCMVAVTGALRDVIGPVSLLNFARAISQESHSIKVPQHNRARALF